jgi:hypothetical protein
LHCIASGLAMSISLSNMHLVGGHFWRTTADDHLLNQTPLITRQSHFFLM